MEDRHLESAAKLLKELRYMTIATTCEDGHPWASPVSASVDSVFSFIWGSSPENTHSQNLRRDNRAFVVIFDTSAPEGTGEGLYMKGAVEQLDMEGVIQKYRFIPTQVWINDEAKNDDGTYKHDIRVELDITELKNRI